MKRLLLFFLSAALCVVPCWATELTVPGMDELWEQAENYGVDPEAGLDQGLSNLFSDLLDQGAEMLRRGLSTGLKLVAVVLLCAVEERANLGSKQERMGVVELAGALSITALTMTDMTAMIGMGRETIERMETFSSTLLPVMAVLTAAAGEVSSAAVRQGATVLFSQFLITAMDRLLIPLVYAYVAVSCACAAVDNSGLSRLAGLLKSTAVFFLSAFLLAFVGYLTASGAIAGRVDAASVKAARLAISRAIPVVGSILADASETVLVGADILRGTVGVAGLLVVLAICLTPFLQLAFQYLTYKITAALCSTVAQPRLSQLIDAIGGAFGLVLGMTGAGALVLLVSLVSAVSAVTA